MDELLKQGLIAAFFSPQQSTHRGPQGEHYFHNEQSLAEKLLAPVLSNAAIQEKLSQLVLSILDEQEYQEQLKSKLKARVEAKLDGYLNKEMPDSESYGRSTNWQESVKQAVKYDVEAQAKELLKDNVELKKRVAEQVNGSSISLSIRVDATVKPREYVS